MANRQRFSASSYILKDDGGINSAVDSKKRTLRISNIPVSMKTMRKLNALLQVYGVCKMEPDETNMGDTFGVKLTFPTVEDVYDWLDAFRENPPHGFVPKVDEVIDVEVATERAPNGIPDDLRRNVVPQNKDYREERPNEPGHSRGDRSYENGGRRGPRSDDRGHSPQYAADDSYMERGRMSGGSSRGGFGGCGSRGGYDSQGSRGGIDGRGSRGSYDGQGSRGGFDGPGSRGGIEGRGSRGSYDGQGSRGGFDGTGSRGGIEGRGSRGNYGSQGSRGGFDGQDSRGGGTSSCGRSYGGGSIDPRSPPMPNDIQVTSERKCSERNFSGVECRSPTTHKDLPEDRGNDYQSPPIQMDVPEARRSDYRSQPVTRDVPEDRGCDYRSPPIQTDVPEARRRDYRSPPILTDVPEARRNDYRSPPILMDVPEARRRDYRSPSIQTDVPEARRSDYRSPSIQTDVPEVRRSDYRSPSIQTDVPEARRRDYRSPPGRGDAPEFMGNDYRGRSAHMDGPGARGSDHRGQMARTDGPGARGFDNHFPRINKDDPDVREDQGPEMRRYEPEARGCENRSSVVRKDGPEARNGYDNRSSVVRKDGPEARNGYDNRSSVVRKDGPEARNGYDNRSSVGHKDGPEARNGYDQISEGNRNTESGGRPQGNRYEGSQPGRSSEYHGRRGRQSLENSDENNFNVARTRSQSLGPVRSSQGSGGNVDYGGAERRSQPRTSGGNTHGFNKDKAGGSDVYLQEIVTEEPRMSNRSANEQGMSKHFSNEQGMSNRTATQQGRNNRSANEQGLGNGYTEENSRRFNHEGRSERIDGSGQGGMSRDRYDRRSSEGPKYDGQREGMMGNKGDQNDGQRGMSKGGYQCPRNDGNVKEGYDRRSNEGPKYEGRNGVGRVNKGERYNNQPGPSKGVYNRPINDGNVREGCDRRSIEGQKYEGHKGDGDQPRTSKSVCEGQKNDGNAREGYDRHLIEDRNRTLDNNARSNGGPSNETRKPESVADDTVSSDKSAVTPIDKRSHKWTIDREVEMVGNGCFSVNAFRNKIVPGKILKVVIRCPLEAEPLTYWVVMASDLNTIECLNNGIDVHVSKDKKMLQNSQKGDMVGALYEGKWYRATVVSTSGKQGVVTFLDFGDKLKVTLNMLVQLPYFFFLYAPFAFKIKLVDSTSKEYDGLVYDDSLTVKVLSSVDENTYEVAVVSDENSSEDLAQGEEPVPHTTIEPEPRKRMGPKSRTVMEQEPRKMMGPKSRTQKEPEDRAEMEQDPRKMMGPKSRTQKEPEPRTVMEQEPRKMMGPKSRTIVESEPRTVMEQEPRKRMGPKSRTIVESEPRMVMKQEPRKIMEPKHRTRMDLIELNIPLQFFVTSPIEERLCWMLLDIYDEQLTNFTKALKKSNLKSLTLEELTPGMAAVSLWQGEGWYRCRVNSKTDDKVHVFFIDYGNEDKVDSSDLRAIPREFQEELPFVVKVKFPDDCLSKYAWMEFGQKVTVLVKSKKEDYLEVEVVEEDAETLNVNAATEGNEKILENFEIGASDNFHESKRLDNDACVSQTPEKTRGKFILENKNENCSSEYSGSTVSNRTRYEGITALSSHGKENTIPLDVKPPAEFEKGDSKSGASVKRDALCLVNPSERDAQSIPPSTTEKWDAKLNKGTAGRDVVSELSSAVEKRDAFSERSKITGKKDAILEQSTARRDSLTGSPSVVEKRDDILVQATARSDSLSGPSSAVEKRDVRSKQMTARRDSLTGPSSVVEKRDVRSERMTARRDSLTGPSSVVENKEVAFEPPQSVISKPPGKAFSQKLITGLPNELDSQCKSAAHVSGKMELGATYSVKVIELLESSVKGIKSCQFLATVENFDTTPEVCDPHFGLVSAYVEGSWKLAHMVIQKGEKKRHLVSLCENERLVVTKEVRRLSAGNNVYCKTLAGRVPEAYVSTFKNALKANNKLRVKNVSEGHAKSATFIVNGTESFDFEFRFPDEYEARQSLELYPEAPTLMTGEKVYIASYTSPVNFYLHRACDCGRLSQLTNDLNIFLRVTNAPSLTQPPATNDLLAVKGVDGKYFRGKVIDWDDYGKFMVESVDFGDRVIVDLADMKEVPDEFLQAPSFAISVELANLDDVDFEKSGNLFLQDVILLKSELIATLEEGNKVKLVIAESLTDINRTLKMLCAKRWLKKNENSVLSEIKGIKSHHAVGSSEVYIPKMHDIDCVEWKRGEVKHVYLSSKDNFNTFVEDPTTYNELYEQIATYCDNYDEWYLPREYELVAAKFDDVTWCRATRLANTPGERTTVYAVDYGSIALVWPSHMRKLIQEFVSYPRLGVICDIHPKSDIPESKLEVQKWYKILVARKSAPSSVADYEVKIISKLS